MELSIAIYEDALQMVTLMALRYTQTVTLTVGFVAVLTWLFCRRFGVTVSTFRRYNLSPF